MADEPDRVLIQPFPSVQSIDLQTMDLAMPAALHLVEVYDHPVCDALYNCGLTEVTDTWGVPGRWTIQAMEYTLVHASTLQLI
jgi:hypothetical protein